ncbi:unnamed protein product, partial [Nesidiocoris tenuis]
MNNMTKNIYKINFLLKIKSSVDRSDSRVGSHGRGAIVANLATEKTPRHYDYSHLVQTTRYGILADDTHPLALNPDRESRSCTWVKMIRRSGVDPDDRRGQSDDGRVSTIILRAIDVSRRGNRSDDKDAQTAIL